MIQSSNPADFLQFALQRIARHNQCQQKNIRLRKTIDPTDASQSGHRTPLPRTNNQLFRSMSPDLAYGRHRGPIRGKVRHAAVAVSLYHDPELGWTIPLTRRPHTLKHHGGQICLPGGRIEEGESAEKASLREFEEELGIIPSVIGFCGFLSRQFVYASRNRVEVPVFVIQRPCERWKPDPVEVESVYPVLLKSLFDERNKKTISIRRAVRSNMSATVKDQDEKLVFTAPAYQLDGATVWGATAMILSELEQVLAEELE